MCAKTLPMKLWLQDQDEVERRVERTAFYSATDAIKDTQSAITVLAVTVTAEIGLVAFVWINKDEAYNFLYSGDEVWIYAGVGLFLIGFFTVFAGYRLFPKSIRRHFLTYTVWIASVTAGIANIALFYILMTFRFR
jgi:hypothetical protein